MASQKTSNYSKQASSVSPQLKSLTNSIDFANDPKKGIHHLKIYADHLENIPGLSKRWDDEIQLRTQQIFSLGQQNFAQKAMALLKRDSVSPMVSGEELMQFHPTKNVQKLVQQLKEDPRDMMNRLELVSQVGQAKREFKIETHRTLLLQAVVACHLRQLSLEGLQLTLWAHSNYLNKLFALCRTQSNKIQGYLESTSGRDQEGDKESRQLLVKKGQEVQRNMYLIQAYQKPFSNLAKKTPNKAHAILELDQIPEMLETGTAGQKKEMNMKILQSAFLMVQIMRYLPLLYPVAHELVDLIIKFLPEHPLGPFMKARLSITKMSFAINRFEAGEKTSEMQKEVQNAFKEGYQYYGAAIKRIGKAEDEMESAILFEYAQTFRNFHLIAKNVLEIKVPHEWVKSGFSKSLKALSMAIDSEQVSNLRKSLYSEMEKEGIAISL